MMAATLPRPPAVPAPGPPAATHPTGYPALHRDLQRARSALVEAELADRPGERFLAGHLAALRVAAVVLALRARPGQTAGRPRNAWLVLAEVAPELAEWAAFFGATEGKREAVRAGAIAIVSAREADDLLRDAQRFLAVVERALGRSRTAPMRAAHDLARIVENDHPA